MGPCPSSRLTLTKNEGCDGGILELTELVWRKNGLVESDDEKNFDRTYKRVVDYGKTEGNELETVCCDVGVMRKVSGTMNEEPISREVGGWIKSGATKLGAMGATQHHLPN